MTKPNRMWWRSRQGGKLTDIRGALRTTSLRGERVARSLPAGVSRETNSPYKRKDLAVLTGDL